MKTLAQEVLDLCISEAILQQPVSWKDLNIDDKDALSAYDAWSSQFYNIVNLLMNKTGYWYVGKSKEEFIKKLKALPPEKLGAFRKEVADLVKVSKTADKIMNQVKNQAQTLIASLG